MTSEVPFGPTGEAVYRRTYSRKLADGRNETWPETAARVARGNLALVYGDDMDAWSVDVQREYHQLVEHMKDFRLIPGGRHLWASGVKGRQYLFNCHVAGWGEKLSDHFEFTFLRLMEGGGVGANYSSEFLKPYGAPRRMLNVHIVCDPNHPDYDAMLEAGVLSEEYDADWAGSFEVEDSREGWAAALVDLIDTYMTDDFVRHANRVYDVSRVRGKGARLKTFGGTASGPLPFAKMMRTVGNVLRVAANLAEQFGPLVMADAAGVSPIDAMKIDHAIAECVVSGGVRRSARMSMLPWNDPWITQFLACKADGSKHWTTNISVVIDDEFIANLEDNSDGGMAAYVHEKVVEGMLTNGEPGYWNIDASNVGEPNPVIATNPCGEIALEAWENCNLGHVNLDAFNPLEGWALPNLAVAHRLMTRFLMRATYGDVNDDKQAEKLARNRRIGVGHLGVQGYLAKRHVRYSDAPDVQAFRNVLAYLAVVVDDEAVAYAHELRIPVPVKKRTVAPTGSIAKLPGVTEGIHPIYARHFDRRVRFSMTDADQAQMVWDAQRVGLVTELDSYDASGNTSIVVYPTKEKLVAEVEALGIDPAIVESADELSVEQMLAFQALYQEEWADNAVSYTVNVPAEEHQNAALLAGEPAPAPSRERVAEVAETIRRYLPLLKGTTVMLDGSRRQAPYTRITEHEYALSLVHTVADGVDEDCANGACPVR